MLRKRALFLSVAATGLWIAAPAWANGTGEAPTPKPPEHGMGQPPAPSLQEQQGLEQPPAPAPPAGVTPQQAPPPGFPACDVPPAYGQVQIHVEEIQPVKGEEPRKKEVFMVPGNVSLITGAGPADYFGATFGTPVGVGVAWDARVNVATRSWLGAEISYNGSANGLNNNGGGSSIISNGIEGDLRLNFLRYRVQPYAFVGVGYNGMRTTGRDQLPAGVTLLQSDSQLTLPTGGGISFYVTRHALFDMRGTYRAHFLADINPAVDQVIDQWEGSANVGYQF